MKRKILVICSALMTLLCLPAYAFKSTTETVEVVEGSAAVGAANLIRTRNSATFRVNTTQLDPNSAYTLWIAAFNKPENCDEDCDATDIAAADGSVYFGTAFVTGNGGVANVEFRSLASRLPKGTTVFAGHGGGIRRGNGFHVEIHLIVSAHGPSASILDWPTELSTPGFGPPFEQVALFK